MAFSWFSRQKVTTETENEKIIRIKDELADLRIQMKEVKNELIKQDIRILENQKNYQTKLLKLVGKEEKVAPKEEKKDIYNGICLLDDGFT